jgi:hypothetical protein
MELFCSWRIHNRNRIGTTSFGTNHGEFREKQADKLKDKKTGRKEKH